MYDIIDVEAAEWIKGHTPSDAIIATTSEGNHMRPESALAGRQILVGYPGWMDSHGMDWQERNKDVMGLFQGVRARTTVLKYNISHIVVDWAQRTRDGVNMAGINSVAHRAASNGRYVIYDVVSRERLTKVEDCLTKPEIAVNREECAAQGCIWEDPKDGSAVCQRPAIRTKLSDDDPIPPIEDCLVAGAKAAQCLENGCSWFEGYLWGPWCQKALVSPAVRSGDGTGGIAPLLVPSDPRDCGWSTVTPTECVMRGCLWTPYVDGPWCVFK